MINKVYKFGGASVKDANAVRNLKNILEKEIPFLIELSHVKNFDILTESINYDTSIDYTTYEDEQGVERTINQNIIIPPLTQYKMIFMNGENLLEEKVKYFDIDFPMNIKPPIKKNDTTL